MIWPRRRRACRRRPSATASPRAPCGVWQLGLLVLFSGVVGYYVIKQTDVRPGADFVVLTMSSAWSCRFLCAVFNRVFGAKQVVADGHRHRRLRGRLVLLKAGRLAAHGAAVGGAGRRRALRRSSPA